MLSNLWTGRVLAAILAVIATAPRVSAVDPDPVFDTPLFNNPAGDENAQYVIFQQLARLIDRVPAGEDIEMSWFEFRVSYTTDTVTKPNIPARLIKAHQRGVNVRIILDNNSKDDGSPNNHDSAPYKLLAPELGTNDAATSYIALCPNLLGCIAKRTIYDDVLPFNHNKFLTATKIVLNNGTQVSGVVFQSSGNLGEWDADTAYNNAITFTEAAPYANYKQYFKDLRINRVGKGDNDYYKVGNTANTYRTHFFPRHESAGAAVSDPTTDTIVSVLDAVKCSYVGETDGKNHQTDVRIAMWSFTRVPVANKLAALVRAGCWVDIAYTEGKMSAAVEKALEDVGGKKIGLTACKVPFQGRNLKIHSKIMLIDGAYDDDQIPRVYMGSHNYSPSALRNADETLIRIRGKEVHDKYLNGMFYNVRKTCSGEKAPGPW